MIFVMKRIFTKKSEREKRKMLRNNMTPAELILWSILRDKDLGYKFRRQHSIGRYVVDFYSPALKLVIEIDGGYHLSSDMKKYDKIRQSYIKALGIKLLRFSNYDILENLTETVRKIKSFIKISPPF